MKIRSSENSHEFQTVLFQKLNAYYLQGLLMNDNHDFTMAVEAIEYEDSEIVTKVPFTQDELYARYILAKQLGVPFYLVFYHKNEFTLSEVILEGCRIKLSLVKKCNEEEFATWWSTYKKTKQTKLLNNGGEARIGETVFDATLRKYGLEWGGNIDGFVLSEDRTSVAYVIDNISVSKANLKDDPAQYFNSPNQKHGPRYEGWYGSIKLSSQLNVPQVLITYDKRNPKEEHVGITTFRRLDEKGVYYTDDLSPMDNIKTGIDNIVKEIKDQVGKAKPPVLVEKK